MAKIGWQQACLSVDKTTTLVAATLQTTNLINI